jgi:glyoxylase-like metal-dependent hydrolase (beta-lactamase superfamily II)/rhodanese-related sulfurtransferase
MTIVDSAVQAMTARDLYAALLAGEPLLVLDVRNPDDFARWHVEGRAGLELLNLPYYAFIEDEDAAAAQVPGDRPVLVVCAKEGSSQYVAEILHAHNREASYLEGGIITWGRLYDSRAIVSADWGRIVQIARPARGDLSFVVVSEGQAAIIDPLRHTGHYLDAVKDAGAELIAIFDTHIHADHISGGPALAAATGAPYFVHPYDAIHPIDMLPAALPYQPLSDGQVFQLGATTIRTIWYPGHTLGQVNFLLETPDGGRYLFSGDGLFLRSFGRPDLGGKGEAWTPLLYASMYERLPRHLTDATLILPAHFSTLDECDAKGRCAANWAEVRRTNSSLGYGESLEVFSAFVLGNLPVFPPQYVEIKRVNLGLVAPSEERAEELELGKNICAVSK